LRGSRAEAEFRCAQDERQLCGTEQTFVPVTEWLDLSCGEAQKAAEGKF
jgi:hypothetical protein